MTIITIITNTNTTLLQYPVHRCQLFAIVEKVTQQGGFHCHQILYMAEAKLQQQVLTQICYKCAYNAQQHDKFNELMFMQCTLFKKEQK